MPHTTRPTALKIRPDEVDMTVQPLFCHPGRRPGIQCAAMPFANARRAQWIPDQVRDDRQSKFGTTDKASPGSQKFQIALTFSNFTGPDLSPVDLSDCFASASKRRTGSAILPRCPFCRRNLRLAARCTRTKTPRARYKVSVRKHPC